MTRGPEGAPIDSRMKVVKSILEVDKRLRAGGYSKETIQQADLALASEVIFKAADAGRPLTDILANPDNVEGAILDKRIPPVVKP